MSRFFRSVGAQLSLALLLVVAIALGIVYLTVVPSLRNRVVNTRVTQLEGTLAKVKAELTPRTVLPFFVLTKSEEYGVRVALLDRLDPQSTVEPQQDSGQIGGSLEGDPVATDALDHGGVQHGTVRQGDTTYAEAAVPVVVGVDRYALLVRAPVELGSIRLVEKRVLLSAGAALLVALLLGYLGARMFARRIRRLERAADRIASGRFDEPVRDEGGGELGALAAAFERMRVRLAQLDDARRAFVANASHELRTPLFSLAGFLELLDDEELDEPTRREFLTSMREQVDRLTKLASDLLDLTRLDAGRLTVEREPVDLAALAQDLVEEFGPLAASSEHPLSVEADGTVLAEADELRALQLGRILVENALLHTPPGSTVEVRARRRGGTVALEVEDAGAGIPPEQREQLFQRFFRLGGTRASGSGLGLAIARELAELMDGAIELESEPGRTVFALILPAAEVPAAPREAVLP